MPRDKHQQPDINNPISRAPTQAKWLAVREQARSDVGGKGKEGKKRIRSIICLGVALCQQNDVPLHDASENAVQKGKREQSCLKTGLQVETQ